MFNASTDQKGLCTEYLAPITQGCPVNYELVKGKCTRVSPFPETFDDAKRKCAQEGSSLLTILDRNKMLSIQTYIQNISSTKQSFQSPFSSDLSNYWVGATVKGGLWTWISDSKNFTNYSNWANQKENQGCLNYACTDNFGLTLSKSKSYMWVAMARTVANPYICEYNCPLGYDWYTNVQKCLKVVDNMQGSTLRSAFYQCAKDNARLTYFKTCADIKNLIIDLEIRNPSKSNSYWIGYFSTLGYYSLSRMTDQNRLQYKTLSSTGFIGPTNCPLVNTYTQDSKGFLQFTPTPSINFLAEATQDDNVIKGYICEPDNSWSCPPGYLLFQEQCYKLFNNSQTFANAQLNCSLDNGYLIKMETIFNFVFILDWTKKTIPNTLLWTGYRRNIETQQLLHIYNMNSTYSTLLFPKIPDGNGDCLVLESNKNTFSFVDCQEKHAYICQTDQATNPILIAQMGSPVYLLPLDNTTSSNTEFMVGFSNTPVLQTELLRSAAFITSFEFTSSISNNGPLGIDASTGLSVGMWIDFTDITKDNQLLVALDDQIYMWIQNSFLKLSVCSTGICMWNDTSALTFSSHIAIQNSTWTFVAFTINAADNLGTFYINSTFGEQNREGQYFSMLNSDFFRNDSVINSIMVGPYFNGKISCLQIFNTALEPAQVDQMLKICYVNQSYPRSKACPPGYTPGNFKPLFCLKLSDEPLTYSQAEVFCTADPNLPYTSQIAYTKNMQIKEILSSMANNMGINSIFVGLDSQAVQPVGYNWTDSSGIIPNDILWASGQPNTSGLCAVLNYSNRMQLQTGNCSDTYYVFCEAKIQQPCPQDHLYYKGQCIYQSLEYDTIPGAKHSCASRGGVVLPIKSMGMYYFVREFSSQAKMTTFTDFLLGINLTTNLYFDKTPYTKQSYDFDGDYVKLNGFPCALLREGIGYKPRGFDCQTPLQYFCIWKNPTCPPGFEQYSPEADGRSCYARSNGEDTSSKDQCSIPGNALRRMALPGNVNLITFIEQKYSFIWIDGQTYMDFIWQPQNSHDFNNKFEDTSKYRSWLQAEMDETHYAENKAPESTVSFKFKPSLCQKDKAFVLLGTLSVQRLTTKHPIVRFVVNKDTLPFMWKFQLEGRNGAGIHSFLMGPSINNSSPLLLKETSLVGYNLTSRVFNLSITCDKEKVHVIFNNSWTGSFNYDAKLFDQITKIQILGGVTVIKAGYTGQGCLALAPNGRVVPKYGDDCQQKLPTVCEHQWCFTTEGFQCIFPFTYKNINYTNCTSEDIFEPWCPTELSANGTILSWGICLEDCPAEPSSPACRNPPPITAFAKFGSAEINYYSSWFNIKTNETRYNVSSQKTRLHHPTWIYNPNNTTDNVSMDVTNNDNDFSPLYTILEEGSIATYTCPYGYTFSGSHSISLFSTCTNWNWTSDFNTSAVCTPVICSLKVPSLPKNSAMASNDSELRKQNDSFWNTFSKVITYTCPEGHVLESPASDNEQIMNITQFNVTCDAARYWRPNLSSNSFPLPPIMPRCIAINCTSPPFEVPSNGLQNMSWTEVPGNARPFGTEVSYECNYKGWGYASNGLKTTASHCRADGTWNITQVEICIKLPCPDAPPPPPDGPGAYMVYGVETTWYKCPNGFMFNTTGTPLVWGNTCYPTRKWEQPKNLEPCIKRNCSSNPPDVPTGFERYWPFRKNELGDKILYRCPQGQKMDIPLPRGYPNLDGMIFAQYGNLKHPQRDQIVECVWSDDADAGHNDSMVWSPPQIEICNGTIAPPPDTVVLAPLPAYPVDYASTTDYYWPHITDNITQTSAGGIGTFTEVPSNGPFGFGPAYQNPASVCISDGKFAKLYDPCIKNPLYCTRGLSFSIWEMVHFPKAIIYLSPDDPVFSKRYVFSTGADYDLALKMAVPGFALYHRGQDVTAVVSTGNAVWELTVRGQIQNDTWMNYGVTWSPPINPTNSNYSISGGLVMYVNLKKVGQAIFPIVDASGNSIGWTALPMVSMPALDSAGNPLQNTLDGPPVLSWGCHYTQMKNGALVSPPQFDYFLDATFDEMSIWTRQLGANSTFNEILYFEGGYQSALQTMTPEKLTSILNSVDKSDPSQSAAAGSLAGTFMSNQPSHSSSSGSASSNSASNSSTNGTGAQPYTVIGVQQLPWKVNMKNQQLSLVRTFGQLLSLSGLSDCAVPTHLDQRFLTIKTASNLLSCSFDNINKWKIVQEDDDLPGSSDYVKQLENYALSFMASANISFYDSTPFFSALTQEYIIYINTEELFLSVQKMPMKKFRQRGPKYNLGLYQDPPGKWKKALSSWDSPGDSVSIPTEMYANRADCTDNPVTFLYAVYTCFGEFAPLRRNPFAITSERFVIDSKVISVQFMVNNKTSNASIKNYESCKNMTDPIELKYTPIIIKLYHKSQETARRKILFHENEIKTSIESRTCVMWNPDIGSTGGWDTDSCTTVMSEQGSTTCECSKFGQYAIAAIKIEKPVEQKQFQWMIVTRYIGYTISIVSLLLFVIVISASRHLWEMFHIIRLNTGICYLMAIFFQFLSELESIRQDRHSNAAFSSLIMFFYLSGSYFLLMESFAEFRAITAGVVGGKTAAYIPIGWGAGFIGLGVTWFLYVQDIGTDPNVFIGWENECKMPFFCMVYVALVSALLLCTVIVFNMSTPQTRKEDFIEDLEVQGQGLAITNFLFVIVWLFAYPAYMKFPGSEMRDFYPVFSIFNSFMGLIILIFLGFSSKRFRLVILQICTRKKSPPKPSCAPSSLQEDKCPIVPLELSAPSSPVASRPTSATSAILSRPTSGVGGELPGAAEEEPPAVNAAKEEEDEDEYEDDEDPAPSAPSPPPDPPVKPSKIEEVEDEYEEED